jgi:hypothetical protein
LSKEVLLDHTLAVRITAADAEKLRAMAEAADVFESQMARRILRAGLAEREPVKAPA